MKYKASASLTTPGDVESIRVLKLFLKWFPGVLKESNLLVDSDPDGHKVIFWLHEQLTTNDKLRKELGL